MSELHFISRIPVEKGWSGEKKYCVTDERGVKYLLRICDRTQLQKKQLEFENMKRASALEIPMCQPLDFGLCEEGVYVLHSWIDGQDAEDVIPALSHDEQYRYGWQAGQALQKLHGIPAPADCEDWESRFNRKIDRKIKLYRDCPLQYENGGGDLLIDYIETHRHLLNNRPQSWQHGDYHIGNMMIDREGQLQIIDFNRSDFGDPWEEFNRIVWCAQAAPVFASGMVDGYFDGAIPAEFWKLLALYISNNTLSSLPWAIPFGQGEIDTMQKQAKEVLAWYDNMTNPIPKWYQK